MAAFRKSGDGRNLTLLWTKGLLIKDGKIEQPVRGATLIGAARTFFRESTGWAGI